MHADKTVSNSDNSNNTSDSARRLSVTTSTDLEIIVIDNKRFIDPLWTGRCLWYCLDLANSLRTM